MDRKTQAQACCEWCLSAIIMGIVVIISGIFIKDRYIVTGIAIATFIGCCILLMLFFDRKEIKKIREERRKKKKAERESKKAELESNFYTAGMPRTFGTSSRQTELREAPSIIVCQVCGANNEKSVRYCHNCGAKII